VIEVKLYLIKQEVSVGVIDKNQRHNAGHTGDDDGQVNAKP
jgi:hypothetical protein